MVGVHYVEYDPTCLRSICLKYGVKLWIAKATQEVADCWLLIRDLIYGLHRRNKSELKVFIILHPAIISFPRIRDRGGRKFGKYPTLDDFWSLLKVFKRRGQ